MSGFISKTGQKWREFCGAQITKDDTLEQRKAEVNDLDPNFRMLFSSYQAISALHQQISVHTRQIAIIVSKIYEKESNKNKQIGIELQALFNNLGELYNSKVHPILHLGDYLKEWFTTIEQLQTQMKLYHEDRLVYDHYLEKVEKLKFQANKERNTDPKTTEKLQRNENKFNNAKTNYQKITREIITKLNYILDNRFKMVNNSLQDFISVEHDLTMNLKSQLKKNLNVMEKFKQPDPKDMGPYDKAKSVLSNISEELSVVINKAKSEVDKDNESQANKSVVIKSVSNNTKKDKSRSDEIIEQTSPSNRRDPSDNSSQIIAYSPIQNINSRSPNQSQFASHMNQNPFFQDEIQAPVQNPMYSQHAFNQQQQQRQSFMNPQGQRPPPQINQFQSQNQMYHPVNNPFQDDFPQQPLASQQHSFNGGMGNNNDPFGHYDFKSLTAADFYAPQPQQPLPQMHPQMSMNAQYPQPQNANPFNMTTSVHGSYQPPQQPMYDQRQSFQQPQYYQNQPMVKQSNPFLDA